MIILEFLGYSWWKKNQKWINFFKKNYNMIQTQFHVKIQVLKTHNARHYFNSNLREFLLKKGIVHQSSYINTTQQNGITEKKNRRLLEVTRAFVLSSHVPKNFWGEVILTAAYLINRIFLMSWVFKHCASFSNHILRLNLFPPFHQDI